MKRIDFIRKSILAAAGIALLPAVIREETDVIQAAIAQIEKTNYIPNKLIVHFKITDQILNNEEWLNNEIKMVCDMTGVGDSHKLSSVEIGLEDDDFIKDIKTVKLTFV